MLTRLLAVCCLTVVSASVKAQVDALPSSPGSRADAPAPTTAPAPPDALPVPGAGAHAPAASTLPPAQLTSPPSVYFPTVQLSRQTGAAELVTVETRLSYFKKLRRHERLSGLGLPIAMMTVGFYPGAALGVLALAELYVGDGDDGHLFDRRAQRLGWALSTVLGVPIGLGGALMMVRRRERRRQYDQEISALKLRRRGLIQHLRWSAVPLPSGAQLTLSARF